MLAAVAIQRELAAHEVPVRIGATENAGPLRQSAGAWTVCRSLSSSLPPFVDQARAALSAADAAQATEVGGRLTIKEALDLARIPEPVSV